MFGLTFEKLVIIVIISAVIIGPQRLPAYAEKLARLVRWFRDFIDVAKDRAESELGVPIDASNWNAQLQQYDPRRIVREALERSDEATSERPPETPISHAAGPGSSVPDDSGLRQSSGAAETIDPPRVAAPAAEPGNADAVPDQVGTDASATKPGGRWIIAGGSSGHPRRVRVVDQGPSAPTHPSEGLVNGEVNLAPAPTPQLSHAEVETLGVASRTEVSAA